MKPSAQLRAILALLAIGILAIAAWLSRPQIAAWTRGHLARRLQGEIAAQPEGKAAQLVRLIEEDDPEWLGVIVAALADSRPAVAFAGEARLLDLVESWEHSPPEEKSSRVGVLARLLATGAPRLPPAQLAIVQGLAQKLLAWPIDGRLVDAARLFADCESVLQLPIPETAEIRLAAAPSSVPTEAGMPTEEGRESIAEEDVASTKADSRNRLPTPLPLAPPEPAAKGPVPLVEANRESPPEPQRLATPRAIRISDR